MPTADIALRLLLAAGLGAAIGLERELGRKPAGLRTNILIAVGSALLTMTSIEIGGGGGTPDRIAAQIVTGIGFLGGGAILRSGQTVHGMTTAATIWVNAAIGMAAGAGLFAMATMTTAITLVVLALLPPIERYLRARAPESIPPSTATARSEPGLWLMADLRLCALSLCTCTALCLCPWPLALTGSYSALGVRTF